MKQNQAFWTYLKQNGIFIKQTVLSKSNHVNNGIFKCEHYSFTNQQCFEKLLFDGLAHRCSVSKNPFPDFEFEVAIGPYFRYEGTKRVETKVVKTITSKAVSSLKLAANLWISSPRDSQRNLDFLK